jgi:hypothetical protein
MATRDRLVVNLNWREQLTTVAEERSNNLEALAIGGSRWIIWMRTGAVGEGLWIERQETVTQRTQDGNYPTPYLLVVGRGTCLFLPFFANYRTRKLIVGDKIPGPNLSRQTRYLFF